MNQIFCTSILALLLAQTQTAEPTAGSSGRASPDPKKAAEVTPAEGPSNFDKVAEAYRRQREAGRVIQENTYAPPETQPNDIEFPETTESEAQQARIIEQNERRPFGDPENAGAGDGKLPEKVDHDYTHEHETPVPVDHDRVHGEVKGGDVTIEPN